jgi:outer membrane protein OmpA-like peptidoglycan-associated protein
MNITPHKPAIAAALFALAALPASGLSAQDYSATAAANAEADGEVLTTVLGSPPADLSGFEAGPKIEGIISARDADRIQVTSADGTNTVLAISEGTSIRSTGGFLGLGRTAQTEAALLNGLPVEVETVRFGRGLVAKDVKFSDGDLETATMIRNGTSQQFAQQGAAIEKNAQATEALRGRMGDIDQYNIKDTTNVYFDTGMSNLSPAARADLCSFASRAEAMDNALLLVVGYTDSVGSQEVNQALSEKRAGRVVNFLQQQCKWKPWRMLTPTGMAEADPMADNSTAAGKAQNRRVSVNILVSKSVDGM